MSTREEKVTAELFDAAQSIFAEEPPRIDPLGESLIQSLHFAHDGEDVVFRGAAPFQSADEGTRARARHRWVQLGGNGVLMLVGLDRDLARPYYGSDGAVRQALVHAMVAAIDRRELPMGAVLWDLREAWELTFSCFANAAGTYVAGLKGEEAFLEETQMQLFEALTACAVGIWMLDG